MSERTAEQARAIIKPKLEQEGLTVEKWHVGEDGLEAIIAGRWRVMVGDADFDEGDEGTLTAAIAGAPEYNTERVYFALAVEGWDEREVDLENLEGVT